MRRIPLSGKSAACHSNIYIIHIVSLGILLHDRKTCKLIPLSFCVTRALPKRLPEIRKACFGYVLAHFSVDIFRHACYIVEVCVPHNISSN